MECRAARGGLPRTRPEVPPRWWWWWWSMLTLRKDSIGPLLSSSMPESRGLPDDRDDRDSSVPKYCSLAASGPAGSRGKPPWMASVLRPYAHSLEHETSASIRLPLATTLPN